MKMQLLRWNNGGPTPGPDTRPASSMVTGAGCRGENPRLRRREKNVLDIPSYRTRRLHIENSPTSAIVISSPNWVQCESGKVPSPLKKALIRAGRTDDRPQSRKEGSFS